MIVACLLLGLYVMIAEIPERWESAAGLLSSMIERESQLSDPDELKLRRLELEAEKRHIEAQLRQYKISGQSPSDFYAFVNDCASRNRVTLESILPNSEASNEHTVGFEFKIKASYHKLGAFINQLETGPYPLRINEVTMKSESPRRSALEVLLRGVVHFAVSS